MKTCIRTLTLSTAAIAATAFAFGPKEDLQAALKKMVPVAEKAFAKEDIQYFHKASTKDFSYTDVSGKTQPKGPALAGLKQMFDTSSNIKVKINATVVSATATMGTIDTVQKWSMETKGPDGKPAKMSMTMKTQETMKKVGGQWLLHKIVEKGMSDMKLNGKPMGAPPTPAPVAKAKG